MAVTDLSVLRRAAVAAAVAAAVGVGVIWRVERVRDLVNDPSARTAAAVLVRPWRRQGSFERVHPAPTQKLEPSSAVVAGRLYVFGGFIRTARRGEYPVETRVDVYDPRRDTWSPAADMPRKITHANAVAVPDAAGAVAVWMVGGFEGDDPGRAVASALVYDVAADRWRDGPSLPIATAGGTLALVGRALHYVGGFAADRDTAVAAHWRLDVDAPDGGWQPRAPLPIARGHLASAVLGGKLYAIGGQIRHDTAPIDLDAVHAYDPEADRWSAVARLPTPRSHFEGATFVDGGRIVVVGGRNDTQAYILKRAGLADVIAYDPARDAWTELPGLPTGIESAAAGMIDGRLVVTAGALSGDIVPQPDTFVGTLAER